MIELKNITKKYGGRKALGRHYTDIAARENNWPCRGEWQREDDASETDGWIVDAEFGKRNVWREADYA